MIDEKNNFPLFFKNKTTHVKKHVIRELLNKLLWIQREKMWKLSHPICCSHASPTSFPLINIITNTLVKHMILSLTTTTFSPPPTIPINLPKFCYSLSNVYHFPCRFFPFNKNMNDGIIGNHHLNRHVRIRP